MYMYIYIVHLFRYIAHCFNNFQNSSCLGLDFNAGNPSRSRCFLHVDESTFANVFQSSDVNQYERVPCIVSTPAGKYRNLPCKLPSLKLNLRISVFTLMLTK